MGIKKALLRIVAVSALALAILCGAACNRQKGAVTVGEFTDKRDGQVYRTVKIGGDWWMAENINYWVGKSGCYGDSEPYCEKYGRLYEWGAAQSACPSGWHLPSFDEWSDLVKTAGGANAAGKMLKSKTGWENWIDTESGTSGNGTDYYGFSALPGGFVSAKGFTSEGFGGGWWSAAKEGAEGAIVFAISTAPDVETAHGREEVAYSVRCVKDTAGAAADSGAPAPQPAADPPPASASSFTDARNGQTYRTVEIGNQTWMAENLSFEAKDSWCYDNDESNCKRYGRLYTWKAATRACPKGWHLPCRDEWSDLMVAVGGIRDYNFPSQYRYSVAGKMLKSKTGWDDYRKGYDTKSKGSVPRSEGYHYHHISSNTGWDGDEYDGSDGIGGIWNGNGRDKFGFSALPGGGFYSHDTSFHGAGSIGLWWSATEESGTTSYRFCMKNGNERDYVYEYGDDKSDRHSVRCVMDSL